MSRLADFLLRLSARKDAANFARAALDPARAQRECLQRILAQNANTEFGREHGFASIRTAADYRAAVPVTDYEHLRESIARMMRGEPEILTAEPPLMFARTSGTSGEAKFLPVTKTCRERSHRAPLRTWFWHALRDHPRTFRGRVLTLVSPAEEGRTPSGLPYGATSGHIYKNLPWAVRSTYLLPYELFELPSYGARYDLAMRLAVARRDVTFLATANPSSIIELLRSADAHSERILKDIADGTISLEIELPLRLRRELEARLKPDKARATELSALRDQREGRLLPRDYWPELALIGCWKAGTVGNHVQGFAQWFDPDTPVRDWGYLSSEARASIPLSDHGAAGVLALDQVYFEFVPAAEVEAEPDRQSSWTFLPAEDLEEGQEYYVFLTTTGGLYRYDINDIVEAVGHWRKAKTIVFRRKGRGMTSLTGEKLSVNQILQAMETASGHLGIFVDHFRAEADPLQSRYLLKVEMKEPLQPERARKLLHAFDEALGSLNFEYRTKRDSRRLRAPLLWVMQPGWYEAEKRRSVQGGKRLFQAKTIILQTRSAIDGGDPILFEVTFGE